MTIRALIAEDEPLARRILWDYLEPVAGVDCVGEAADGLEAVRRIDADKPDLLFLDVHMPELSGLDVMRRIHHRPVVVFTTAYDRYAVTAFELEAVDYLLKPFSRKRFLATLERVRQRLTGPTEDESPEDRARDVLAREAPLHRVFARKGGRIVPIALSTVDHFEAAGDYVRVHGGQATASSETDDSGTHLLHVTLSDLEKRLDPRRFRRVHRSHIINLDRVVGMRPHDDRRLTVFLRGGGEVVASRKGSQCLRELVL